MQPEKSCDYNDHDHYADDVENIYFIAPIEATLGQDYGVDETRSVTNNLDCGRSIHRRRRTAALTRR
jgi:hypothetical protein